MDRLMNVINYLIPLIVITVGFLIRAEIKKIKVQFFILKPISTLLVISVAALSFISPGRNMIYSVGVLIGLVFSLGGDIALLYQERRKAFMTGLVLFLAAHIAYTAVFMILGRFTPWDLLIFLILFGLALAYYRLIKPNLGTMKGPVIVYMLIISLMFSRAFSCFFSPSFNSSQAWMIFSGAFLFFISDIVLAANRFWRPMKYHRLSLIAYYGGQLLIALGASHF